MDQGVNEHGWHGLELATNKLRVQKEKLNGSHSIHDTWWEWAKTHTGELAHRQMCSFLLDPDLDSGLILAFGVQLFQPTF